MSPSKSVDRRHLDHDLFAFRTLREAGPLSLSARVRAAVSLVIVLQDYRLEASPAFSVPGALERPFPDIGTFSQRQVGTTDGLWRIVDAIESRGVGATFVIESGAIPRLFDIGEVLKQPHHALVAGGRDAATLLSARMSAPEQMVIIEDSLAAIHQAYGRTPIGWRSSSCVATRETFECLVRAGVRYSGDLANDDRPYLLNTAAGPLWSMPMNHFFSDLHLIYQQRQHEAQYFGALRRAAQWLCREAPAGDACVLPIVLHPWLSGTPHRIAHLERLIDELLGEPAVGFFTTDQLFDACRPVAASEQP